MSSIRQQLTPSLVRLPFVATLVAATVLSASAAGQGLGPSQGPAAGELVALGGSCPDWIDTFDAEPGVNGQILDMVAHDDGSGPALYVGGNISSAGGVPVQSVARWDGNTWSAVGAGLNGLIHDLVVHDDGLGGGPALYAGGSFTMSGATLIARVAKWDGSRWSAVGLGMDNDVYALGVHGGELYAGGNFSTAGGVPAAFVARWNGSTWSALGSGTPGAVLTLHSHDDGGGQALYVGGFWNAEPGFPHDNLARWDGAAWSDVGGGVASAVWAMATFDSGSGPRLLVSGPFSSVNGGMLTVPGIASWDGAGWSVPFTPTTSGIEDMAVGDIGNGSQLFLSGTVLDGVASWDGNTLQALGDFGQAVNCVTVFDTGSGGKLACGGAFTATTGSNDGVSHVAQWGGSNWQPIGEDGLTGFVRTVHAHDDGSGPALFVGGLFSAANGLTGEGFGRYKSGGWSDLGGTTGSITDFASYNDGTGDALYASGAIFINGASPSKHIVRYGGGSWTSAGVASRGIFGASVNVLHVHDDGNGAALYAGGKFDAMNGVPANNIARWDGSSWTPLDVGLGATVLTMESYDDGTGSQLYVGGTFATSTGAAFDYIARWDGSNWSALGGAPAVASGNAVRALQVYEGLSGEFLFVGGTFDSVAGLPFSEGLVRFDGSGWSGLPFLDITGSVNALTVYRDVIFTKLIVGGDFEGLGLFNANNLASWSGNSWGSFGTGVNDVVRALTVADAGDAKGPVVVAGGDFTIQHSAPQSSSLIARWGGCWAGINNWTDLGFALAGTAGDPLLTGTGSLAPASYNTVKLVNANPSSLAALFISLASTPIPFMGGTLVPNPFIDPPIFVTTSPSGKFELGFVMPEGVPPGTDLFVQWAIVDGGGPNGVAMSNALRGDVP